MEHFNEGKNYEVWKSWNLTESASRRTLYNLETLRIYSYFISPWFLFYIKLCTSPSRTPTIPIPQFPPTESTFPLSDVNCHLGDETLVKFDLELVIQGQTCTLVTWYAELIMLLVLMLIVLMLLVLMLLVLMLLVLIFLVLMLLVLVLLFFVLLVLEIYGKIKHYRWMFLSGVFPRYNF